VDEAAALTDAKTKLSTSCITPEGSILDFAAGLQKGNL
jgi:hypothetical protein